MNAIPNQAKIIKVSTVLWLVLLAGVVVWAIGIAMGLSGVTRSTIGPATPLMRFRAWGFLGMEALRFMVTWKLCRFFYQLKAGRFFEAATVGYLDAVGKWWIVLWLYSVIFYQLRAGVFQIVDQWNPKSPEALFGGLVIIFMAWLWKEAQGLQEEKELTV